ncbi:MAG TPA: dihydroorotate dehydrogenase electron transfer subunit [Clostridiales bacterium]|nr:dihydroorotate dehydrogenase electron transfer subunit [Clostridiales bacterium]
MKKSFFTVAGNRLLAENTYEMVLRGDSSAVKKPGQFVHIALDGFYLRRPISVCDWSEHSITMIYKTVGKGTAYMAGLEEGDRLEVLTGLGNGFDSKKSGNKPLLIGGGAGIPPLYALAKKLMQEQKQVFAILGFNRVDEVFYAEEFASLGVNVIITTVDGSVGRKGFVTDAMEIDMADYTYTYSCGPEPMLKAVYEKAVSDGQYSFEERMGCGFGACMGCACQTKYGSKRICREGPVLEKEEIVW